MNFVVNSRIDTESTLERSASISISTVRSGGAHGIRQPREVRVRNGIRLYHHRWHTRRRKPNPRVDLTGIFCTSGSEREFTLEGSWYADQEIQAGADRDAAAAG
jgi:hypothetical protein